MRLSKAKPPKPSRTRPLSHRPPSSDVIVIGSGAVGAACAAALARAKLRVRVLSQPGRGTTAVSGGHLLLQSKRPGPTLELARRSLELLSAFAAGREDDLLYRRTGSLILADSAEAEADLRAHHDALVAAGVPVEWLGGDAARALEPALSERILAASYCPTDAQVHPSLLAGEWLAEALAHKAQVTSGGAVESFVTSGGRLSGVIAGGVEYEAKAVVLAAGVWSGELAAMAGAKLEIRPRRGVLLRGMSERVLTSRPLLGAEYLGSKFGEDPHSIAFSLQQHPVPGGAPEPAGACILGGSRSFDDFSEEGIEPAAERIRECAVRYLPALAGMDWSETNVGFRPWTPDGLPRIGPCEVPGLWLACGHEGDGITLAAATAERVTQFLTSGR